MPPLADWGTADKHVIAKVAETAGATVPRLHCAPAAVRGKRGVTRVLDGGWAHIENDTEVSKSHNFGGAFSRRSAQAKCSMPPPPNRPTSRRSVHRHICRGPLEPSQQEFKSMWCGRRPCSTARPPPPPPALSQVAAKRPQAAGAVPEAVGTRRAFLDPPDQHNPHTSGPGMPTP